MVPTDFAGMALAAEGVDRSQGATLTVRRILVPIDFAGCAYDVVATAAVVAGGLKAEAILLYVVQLPTGVDAETVVHPHGSEQAQTALDLLRDDARAHIDPLAEVFADHEVPVSHVLRQGEIVEAILQTATDVDADLIIMGTHGRKGLQRFFLGSVAEQIIRRAEIPVTTVRARDPDAHAGFDPAQLQVLGETDG